MARTLKLVAHSSDNNTFTFPNDEEHLGYVPTLIGLGGGDYIRLEIDIDTGHIVGWNDTHRDEILRIAAELAAHTAEDDPDS